MKQQKNDRYVFVTIRATRLGKIVTTSIKSRSRARRRVESRGIFTSRRADAWLAERRCWRAHVTCVKTKHGSAGREAALDRGQSRWQVCCRCYTRSVHCFSYRHRPSQQIAGSRVVTVYVAVPCTFLSFFLAIRLVSSVFTRAFVRAAWELRRERLWYTHIYSDRASVSVIHGDVYHAEVLGRVVGW